MGVNISPAQLHSDALDLDAWLARLTQLGLPGSCLVAEITESVLLEADMDVAEKLARLRAAGLQMAIDDFGTGYSALSYLKHFPVEYLKIDQTFVREIVTDANDKAIVVTIIAIAGHLGLDVIAEGVETREQLEALRECGCERFQGYLFGRPDVAERLFSA